MKSISLKLIFCITLLGSNFQSYADHIAGSDISYTCTSTPGIWHITFAFYRTCAGIALCPTTCGASCNFTLNWATSDPNCSTSGTVDLALTNVRDVNTNPQCPSAKNICNNMGCETAGTYTPGVERYQFEGDLDLRGLPTSCCNIVISWYSCCRSGEIVTGSTWQGYYTECTLNRCVAPCNSSPEISNDPITLMCGGQPYVFNNGAIDPDHDSLSFAFTPSLQSAGSSVTYNSPYSYDAPMPYTTPKNGAFPLGIHCDPSTGDIMFTPPNGAPGSPFCGVMAVEIKQWRTINGVITNIGKTRRDIQMWLVMCTPNNPPSIMTNPSNVNQPKLSWQICAGEQICFDVIGKDTDYLPLNSPPISDTTYLTWNGALASKGATFLPTYNTNLRSTNGPREDKYQFCWTPSTADASTTPYYFTVNSKDNRCPNAGQSTRAFSITVLAKADVSIVKTNFKCGKWRVTYVKNKPSQSFISTVWNISKVPNDFSGMSVNTYLNSVTPPIQNFTKGGKYLVELDINTPGPSGGNPCQVQFFDTITVDTFVQVFVSDTSLCHGNTVTIPYYAKWGQAPYTFRWFIAPDTLFPLNGPIYSSSTFTLTPQSTKRYTLQVRDVNGCRAYDSNVIITVYQPIIGNILGPQNLNNISTPVNYSITPQAKDTFIWTVFGGSILSGQATNAINVQWSSNGIKTVTLMATDSINCYDSIGENVTINVGLNKVTGFANLSVYPNPTTGLVNVDFESSEKTIDLEVLDVLGKSILRSTSKHSGGLFQKTLDLSALQEGIYFVKISVGEKSTTVKVTLD